MNGQIPVPNRHRPFLHDIFQTQVKKFNRRLIVWKAVSGFGNFPERIIQGFYRVCGVDRFSNLF